MKILDANIRILDFVIMTDDGLTFDVAADFDNGRQMIQSISVTKDGKPIDIGDGNVARIEDFLQKNWMDSNFFK